MALNYHHLRYFWSVAREGSVRKAAQQLRVSEPTISAQLRALQTALGAELFRRSGRGLVLTETGRLVYGLAGEIFSLGEELVSCLQGESTRRELKFNVGLADSIPKLVAHEILKPVFRSQTPIHVVCREGKVDDLLAQLATLRLDIVLADEPAPASLKVKTFNHLLGACGVSFCASPALARRLRGGFPQSLHHAPALLPTQNTNLRRSLEKWFHSKGITPRIVGEFEDAAMGIVMAADGLGFMPMPAVVKPEAWTRHQLRAIGKTVECQDQFYAITADRKLTHPAVLLVTENAQSRIFGRAEAG